MHNLSLQNIATEEKTENSQEASNKSEVTIQSDASFLEHSKSTPMKAVMKWVQIMKQRKIVLRGIWNI